MEKEDNQAAANRKTSSSTRPLQEEQVIKCPRCDSPNTKFCYYNNYSLTQPRHFCKTCRRYWTKGGALRSVPIGGGCRKNKKVKSSSRLSGDSRDSSELGGLKFFQGLSPAMDFQLGGLSFSNPSPPPTAFYNQNLFGGDSRTSSSSASCFNLDPSGSSGNLLGFNYGYSSSAGPMNLASSIESLSSINQDLRWKLQQQRLAMIFGTGESKLDGAVLEKSQPQPLPVLFDNLEGSEPEAGRDLRRGGESDTTATTEWFFGNSFAATVATTTRTSENTSWNIGIPAWSTDLHQYSSLP